MKEPISLKEIMAVVIRKGRFLFCAALVAALLLGGYKFIGLRQEAGKPENSPEQIQLRYQQALETWEEQKQYLNKQIAATEDRLAQQKAYIENSVLMELDPHNTANCIMILAVSGLDIPEEPGMESAEARSARMVAKIQELYQLYWKNADLQRVLEDHGYVNREEKYHRETCNVEITAGGTLTVSSLGVSPEDAARLARAVYDSILEIKPLIEEGSYSHDLTVVSNTNKMVILTTLEGRQEEARNLYKSYSDELKNLQKQLENLPEPVPEAGFGMGQILKSTVKWMVIGGIVGVILGCVWVLVMFLMRSKMESSRQLEKMLGIPFLGSAAKAGSFWDRLADKLLGERRWKDPLQAAEFISENLKALADTGAPLAIITTLPEEKAAQMLKTAEAAATAACQKVHVICEAEKNPQTPRVLSGCGQVLLAERAGVSDMPAILALKEIAKRMDVTVVGFINL